jgi:hypothetical protein
MDESDIQKSICTPCMSDRLSVGLSVCQAKQTKPGHIYAVDSSHTRTKNTLIGPGTWKSCLAGILGINHAVVNGDVPLATASGSQGCIL